MPASLAESWQVDLTDELERRDRIQTGRYEQVGFVHNGLHQVLERTGSTPGSYTWDVHGNLAQRTGGPYGDAVFTHDWRDRLVRVEQGSTTTDIVLDPLGRMVGKVRHTPDGDVARAYLHDGDQVVLEYVQEAGGTGWIPERRHLWARWIDDLAVEQVDTDGDGTLETTLYPITDLLGSVHLLTDDTGTPLERITYDPDGTPHFWSADTTRPSVTRIAWTGDGTDPRCGAGIPPQPCPAAALEVGFEEALDPESVADATATLTPQGGNPLGLTLQLTPDGRAAYLTGATVQAGVQYTLHLEGLRDRAGNPLWPADITFSVSDVSSYQVLEDTASPSLLAILDTQDGLYLVLDEPVDPAAGFDLDSAVTLTRQGQPVAGTATPISRQILRWRPAEEGTWLAGGAYTLTALHLQDLAGNAITAPSPSFTHLAASPDLTYLAYEAPTDSQPEAQSAYGLTTTFQGRTWHPDLGAYHYRARWYLPEAGVFAERDPVGYVPGPNLNAALGANPAGVIDPEGTFQDWALTGEYKVRQKQPPSSPDDTPELQVDYLAPWLSRAASRAISTLARRKGTPEDARRVLSKLLRKVGTWALRASRTDPATEYLAEVVMEVGEELRGTGGVSLEGGLALASLGIHAGVNFQLFPPSRGSLSHRYRLGMYGFETVSNMLDKYRFWHIEKREAEGVFAPFGLFGVFGSGGFAVNGALATGENDPRMWKGFFGTLSVSWPAEFPMPSGASVFRSSPVGEERPPKNPPYIGGELSWGVGAGAMWSRPYFHLWAVISMDRPTARRFLAATIRRGLPW